MKLKNKKTGEIKDWSFAMLQNVMQSTERKHYGSLAELNAEWEDYEEPKEYWYMDYAGFIHSAARSGNGWEVQKKIGNCFETKEEAEAAVEKLRAWKRLKDGGFVFCGKGDCLDTIKFDYGEAGYNNQDFNLLFGGEE